MRRRHWLAILGSVAALLATASLARAFDAAQEAHNFSKIGERERYLTLTPEFQAHAAGSRTHRTRSTTR